MVNKNNALRVSLVIPVYNEATSLAACLHAIQLQDVTPYEVIVVDNNSNDATTAIARQFDFVRLISEPRQGVVHARTRGFKAARGDIIGRIDADTILPANWIRILQEIMADSTVAAVSGSVYYHDVIKPELAGRFDLFFRQRLADQLGSEVFLCGSNMAIRRTTWRRIQHTLCDSGGLHEDFDLAIHIQLADEVVVFDSRLRAGVSLRRFGTGFMSAWRYMRLSPRTYALHGRKSQRHMYPIIAVVLSTYWFIWLNYNGYDSDSRRFSVRKLWLPNEIRVNPATYVDS